MKVLIVSGFLGAGKTTFIRTLSNRLNKDFVILENEYASINIDKDIIKDDTGLNVWEFTEKCICCSGKADFAMNILTIANTISPEYLIVEPTGVFSTLSSTTSCLPTKSAAPAPSYYPKAIGLLMLMWIQ